MGGGLTFFCFLFLFLQHVVYSARQPTVPLAFTSLSGDSCKVHNVDTRRQSLHLLMHGQGAIFCCVVRSLYHSTRKRRPATPGCVHIAENHIPCPGDVWPPVRPSSIPPRPCPCHAGAARQFLLTVYISRNYVSGTDLDGTSGWFAIAVTLQPSWVRASLRTQTGWTVHFAARHQSVCCKYCCRCCAVACVS